MTGQAIFIGYRREDTMDTCGRIYDRLAATFGASAIFRDVDNNIPLGEDFRRHIAKVLQQCRVALILIGPMWLNARSRLDDLDDPVRLEIEEANKNAGVQVIPVLVNGASMPEPADLPESLRFMTRLNAPAVRRDPDFHRDMDDLIAKLKEGALTGFVKIDAPLAGPEAAAAAWREVEPTLSVAEYRRVADSFPNTAICLEARRQADALERIRASQDIDNFLARWPSHPGKIELLARRDELISAANESQRAALAREAAEQERVARQLAEEQERVRRQLAEEQERVRRQLAEEQERLAEEERDRSAKTSEVVRPLLAGIATGLYCWWLIVDGVEAISGMGGLHAALGDYNSLFASFWLGVVAWIASAIAYKNRWLLALPIALILIVYAQQPPADSNEELGKVAIMAFLVGSTLIASLLVVTGRQSRRNG